MSRIVTEDDHKLITRALAAEGGHLGIGHAGFHLEWGNGWFSGYDCDELKQACIARGLPVIDNRNVSYGALCWIVICGPLVAVGKPADPPPSRSDPPEGQAAERPEGGALSYAPLAVIAAACRAAGADVQNIPEADLEAGARALSGCRGVLWIHSDEYGEPEHVIRFVRRCAEALNLQGVWGFTWSLSCSRPRLDAFGGGAHVIDLGKRETVAWVDCSNWVIEHMEPAAPATEEAGP